MLDVHIEPVEDLELPAPASTNGTYLWAQAKAGLIKGMITRLLEEAARASVMTVLEIPFAYVMQYVLFHDEMNALGLVGVGFVMGGIYPAFVQRFQVEPNETSAGASFGLAVQ